MTLSDSAYISTILPIYLIGMCFLSYIFFGRIRYLYMILWASLGTFLSMFLSSTGEIIFGILFAAYMLVRDKVSDLFWIFLFMEIYLFIINIEAFVSQIALKINHPNRIPILLITCFICNLIFAMIITWLLLKKRKQIDEIRTFMAEKSKIGKNIIIYAGIVCFILYVFEIVFDELKIPLKVVFFILTVLIIFIIINTVSLFFLMKSYKEHLELIWLKHAEAAKKEYYADLNQQQTHTNKILHDYKNLLTTLQLSLSKASTKQSSDTQEIIAQAQTSLNKSEINSSVLNSIESVPLKSLIYLKWTEAANKKIDMIIQVNGCIPALKKSNGLSIIRALGILIDNAIDETSKIHGKQFEVLVQIGKDNNLELTVANHVAKDFKLSYLNGSGFTTKGDNHGQGMAIINDLIKKYNGFNIRKKLIKNRLEITLYVKG